MRFVILLLFLILTVPVLGQSYSSSISMDKSDGSNKGQVQPGYTYTWTREGWNRRVISGTTPTLSWNTNEYIARITADTTFTFGNSPSDTNILRRMHILVIGNGTANFTNTTDTITWNTPVTTPINGITEYWFEYSANGTIYGWQSYEIEYFEFFLTDESTTPTASSSTAVLTWRVPYAFTITGVRASVTAASSSGTPTIDIKDGGTTIFSTLVTLDANEKTTVTAATPAVLSDTAWAEDAEITFFITVSGTGTTGFKIKVFGYRP